MNTTPRKIATPAAGLFVKRAFTLIELLVVIAVIAVIAGMILGVVKGVEKSKYISTARSQMGSLQTALERYKAAYGVYPAATNFYSLYYELVGVSSAAEQGVTTVGQAPTSGPLVYTTLDGSHKANALDLAHYAGVSGIINCTRGAGDDLVTAKTFLPNLRANEVATNSALAFLVTSVGGPDQAYQPLGLPGVNDAITPSTPPTIPATMTCIFN
jgi:prepilin-type N-terminal cleavage/methylation domain-containing protein